MPELHKFIIFILFLLQSGTVPPQAASISARPTQLVQAPVPTRLSRTKTSDIWKPLETIRTNDTLSYYGIS